MRIVIAGGGTAGHIYPGLALAEALKSRFKEIEIVFVGTTAGLEAEVIPSQGYELKIIDVKGFKREFSRDALTTIWKLFGGVRESKKILKKNQPQVVVGLGGYVSAAPVIAALVSGIPTVIHEQNALPGLANRLLGRLVDKVAISYPDSKRFFPNKKVHLVGNPIRREILAWTRPAALDFFKLDASKKTLLVFGGSRGSQKINQTMLEAYSLFNSLKYLQIIHITGKLEFKRVRSAIDSMEYLCLSYLEDIGTAYAAADLAICRAGATSIAELTGVGLPAILIPYPGATNGHQEKNARFLVENGAAEMILDQNLNGEILFKKAKELLESPSRLGEMRKKSQQLSQPEAAERLAELVGSLVKE